MEFCKTFNAQTQNLEPGMPIPVVITAYGDRSFTFVTKTPPASYFLKKAAGVDKGSQTTGKGGAVGTGDDGPDPRDRRDEDGRSQRQRSRRGVPDGDRLGALDGA